MSALNVDKEETMSVPEAAVELLDCGRASERTQGVPLPLILEVSLPPDNYLLIL
jgi:hypothetical protein